MYGLDTSIPTPRNNKVSVWITARLGNQLVCKQKGFDGMSKEDAALNSLKSFSSARNTLVHAGRNTMSIETQASTWQLIPGSHQASDDMELSKKQPTSSGTKKIVMRKTGACAWGTKNKNLITSQMPKMKIIAPCNWFKHRRNSRSKKDSKYAGSLTSLGEIPCMPYRNINFENKKKRGTDRDPPVVR